MILVDMGSTGFQRQKPHKRQFKFEAKWLQSEGCRRVIQDNWTKELDGDAHMVLWKKIQRCRVGLLRWNKEEFKRPRQVIKKLEERYTQLEGEQLTEDKVKELAKIRSMLAENETREMIRWQQRSKEHRLANGDDGVWRDKEEDIQSILLQHFQSIFASSRPLTANIDEVVATVPTRVTPEMNSQLALSFTTLEVKQATFGMFPFKLPGPDDMSPLTLLKFSELRPISLCNVIVKITSKCIANRLKDMMDDIVSPTQSAFIPGRLITDNVLLAFELNHFLKVSSWAKQGYVDLKLDMSIAYDRIEWPFLRRILSRLGFQTDDTLLFCKALDSQMEEIKRILKRYAEASGQIM
ncbi:UNVERIFIED_CONTAM: hypothetical protein Sradi_1579000 [Sesamum radiatum]|uniref:Reverse transcriptase domain-containing protein n=1 Tax=Sesamum radiatum TaxID=300843 RepID=A0AAW2U9G0_SESRA